MPRRKAAFFLLGYALGVAFGPTILGRRVRTRGHSPAIHWLRSAGHSRRLTSGGKAEPNVVHNILGNVLRYDEVKASGVAGFTIHDLRFTIREV